MIDDSVAETMRAALTQARFTPGAVHELLGDSAHRALLRNETIPAVRATADGSPLSTLIRLFSLQRPVEATEVDTALPGLVDPLCLAGVLERTVSEVRARVDIRPYGDEEHDWWVMCDLTPGLDGVERPVSGDHVLGISEASMSLAQLTVREPAESALDLGAGCGVQSLHLSSHAQQVVATDVNPRALAMARATALLNGLDHDVRDGSLFDPVAGEDFDLIVTNPPFVVSPGTGEPLVYRDSGMPGDEVVRRIVSEAPAYLRPGGRLHMLANWVHRSGPTWQERLGDWLTPTGCDAWVVQREVLDLPRYVELWLADAGLHGTPEYRERYDTWLSWFADEGIEAVGFGWISMHRGGRDHPAIRLEDWPYEMERPVAPQVAAWERSLDVVDLPNDALMDQHLHQVDGLIQEDHSTPGLAEPDRIVVRQGHGLRRARQVDTVEAGLVGACDGELSVGRILDALAELLGQDPAEARAGYTDSVRELVETGYLIASEAAERVTS